MHMYTSVATTIAINKIPHAILYARNYVLHEGLYVHMIHTVKQNHVDYYVKMHITQYACTYVPSLFVWLTLLSHETVDSWSHQKSFYR